MPAESKVVISELMRQLAEDDDVRSRFLSRKPRSASDLAELVAKGPAACPSCRGRLRAVLNRFGVEDVHHVYGVRATAVDPKPLVLPRVIKVGHADDLEAALARVVLDDGVLLRMVTPFHQDGELYALVQ